MSAGAPRLRFTSIRPDGTVQHYALAPPAHLARAVDADPTGEGKRLLQLDERTIRIQARAVARWGRWYAHTLDVPLHRWWRHMPDTDAF